MLYANEYHKVSTAFVAGKSAQSSKVRCRYHGITQSGAEYSVCDQPRLFTDLLTGTLFSYDRHFPLAIKEGNGDSIVVNLSDYEVGEWKSGKPKVSQVTRRQREALLCALADAGYTQNGAPFKFLYQRLKYPVQFTVVRYSR